MAELTHAPQTRIDQLAGIFVLLRVIYTALYVADQACGQSPGRLALSPFSGCSCSAYEARRRVPTGHSALFADVVDSGGTRILGRLDLDSLLRAVVPAFQIPTMPPDEHPGTSASLNTNLSSF